MKNKGAKLKFFGFNRLMPYFRPYRGLFAAMIISQLAIGAFSTVIPLFQQYALNNFIAPGTLQGFAPFVCAYVACLLAYLVIGYVADYNSCKIEMFVLRDLRRAAFNHLQTLSVSYFNRNSVGYIHSRIMSDASNISAVVAWDINMGLHCLVYIVGSIGVMFFLDPLLALCVVCAVPLATAISVFFNHKLTVWQRKVRESNSQITSDFNEGISGVATGKSLAIENKLMEEFGGHTSQMKRVSVRHGRYRALFVSLISLLSSAALALVLWYGGVLTVRGAVLIGTLSVFMTYAQTMCDNVRALVELLSDLVSVKVNTERFSALMDEEPEVADAPEVVQKYGDSFEEKRQNWEKMQGEIEFKNVTFRYPDGGEDVLEGFNLKVPQGTSVAIVGETGAGKSTLVNLICRFFEPTEGEILIDGRPARERSVQWLHSNIGYVLQTPHLFSGTLRENLLYGNLSATDAQIEEALKSVNALGIAQRLGGLDARIGEGGNSLSVGEKQLISFARAILADPAVYILDEATSSIDAITEDAVQKAVFKLMQGRTGFIIAHRLSTVRSADKIVVLEGGKIAEQGTHKELLKARGQYYELYMRQFKEEQIKKSV